MAWDKTVSSSLPGSGGTPAGGPGNAPGGPPPGPPGGAPPGAPSPAPGGAPGAPGPDDMPKIIVQGIFALAGKAKQQGNEHAAQLFEQSARLFVEGVQAEAAQPGGAPPGAPPGPPPPGPGPGAPPPGGPAMHGGGGPLMGQRMYGQ